MRDIQSKVNRTVQDFVAQITMLAQHAAHETLQRALGGPVATRAGGRGTTHRRRGRPRGSHSSYSPRRTPEDLEALSIKLTAFVLANPGLRIEQINKPLGTTTKALVVPIRKLVAAGVFEARHDRGSTTYIANE